MTITNPKYCYMNTLVGRESFPEKVAKEKFASSHFV